MRRRIYFAFLSPSDAASIFSSPWAKSPSLSATETKTGEAQPGNMSTTASTTGGRRETKRSWWQGKKRRKEEECWRSRRWKEIGRRREERRGRTGWRWVKDEWRDAHEEQGEGERERERGGGFWQKAEQTDRGDRCLKIFSKSLFLVQQDWRSDLPASETWLQIREQEKGRRQSLPFLL